jgi:6,7-dimethyl-8-ribityllumazine synthase
MTSSEETALAPGLAERLAGRCGRAIAVDPADHTGGAGLRLGVVCGRFNGGITARLLEALLEAAQDRGVAPSDVTVAWVPGAFELPVAAAAMASSGVVDAVVALGAVIRGDTPHFDFVAGQCAAGLQQVSLTHQLPVVFGVLTTETVAQALERCGPGPSNKGWEAALTAIETVRVLAALAADPAGAR